MIKEFLESFFVYVWLIGFVFSILLMIAGGVFGILFLVVFIAMGYVFNYYYYEVNEK